MNVNINIIVSIAQQNLQENGVCQKVFVKQYLQLNSLFSDNKLPLFS